MGKKQPKGGIERKFLTSIIWVGVIPMFLALLIGYVFAREGQQIAVQQNLNTAAQKTAEGVRRTLQERLRLVGFVAESPHLAEAFRQYEAGEELSPSLFAPMPQGDAMEDLAPAYSLYTAEGELILHSGDGETARPFRAAMLTGLEEPAYVGFSYIGEKQRYANHIVAPVRDPDTGELLGYLGQMQGMQDLLEYLLGHAYAQGEPRPDPNNYELIYLAPGEEFVVYLDEQAGEKAPPPRYHALDSDLSRLIRAHPERDFYSDRLLRYSTRGRTMPVLMAYHRIDPQPNLYLLAYRSTNDIFTNINLAALLTLLVSSLVIGFFCIVAYRIVNNNIIRPVSLLNEGAQIIRQGDLELKLKIGTGDEIEELAMSFNKMATALRHNIHQLEASELRYRNLITAMRDGIFQTDNQGQITLLNPAACEIWGYGSEGEVIGKSVQSFFLEDADFQRIQQELSENKLMERSRIWMKRRDGRAICVELTVNSGFDDEGKRTGFEGTLRDVTQNLRLEQEARERSERISAINQIANAINSSLEAGRVYESLVDEVRSLIRFDFAAVALVSDDGAHFEERQLMPEQDEPGRIVRDAATPGCSAWVMEEGQCLVVEDLRSTDEAFRKQFPSDMLSALCVPLFAGGRIIGTLNLASSRRKGFTSHEAEVMEQMMPHVAVAIRNAKLLENLQVSLEEVTRAREKLHDANEELKTLDELKTNLLSNVSHELRTPLVAVMGYTDMILNRKVGPVNEVQEEYLSISLRNIEKLVTLIENLLDFSKLHRGAEELVFDTFDIVECARLSMQSVKPVADGRNMALVLDDPGEPVLIEGDKGKLGQVFINLLSNAVKFNENGGSVTIIIKLMDDDVEVTVKDTGIGIPEDAQDKIFTRFYQYDASSTRKYGGTGIGLAIAQDIMRLHGTRITVRSKVGEGAEFRFVLPLSAIQRAQRLGEEYRIPLPTETHLLVELVTQDRALSNQIRSMLLSEGMDVIHAAYPAAAISLASKYSPDVILVDSEAGPLGSLVLEEIVADPFSEHTPVVLLTNDDDLYERYRTQIASRVKRSFRKSGLLSGIHQALSRGMDRGEQLGNRVLCVDDDPEIVMFITRCLEAEGFETDHAKDGAEALEKVAGGDYWLVLLDIAMPGMDGWETCRRIKKMAGLEGIKVLFVTAKPIDKGIADIHECGAEGYIQKPFKADDLMALVEGYDWRQMSDRP